MTTEPRMLHTVNKSPFERNALSSCLRLAKKGSAILLIEDGVYAALGNSAHKETIEAQKANFTFFALGPDMIVRGISEQPLIDGIEVIDYDGFVDLVAEYDSTQSWL